MAKDKNSNALAFVVLGSSLGLLSTIALAASGFALKWQFEANATMAVLTKTIDTLVADTEAAQRRDATLSKHWKLHTWAKDQINALRTETHQAGQVSWPDLD